VLKLKFPVMSLAPSSLAGRIQYEADLSVRLLEFEDNPQWHPEFVLDATGRLFPVVSVEKQALRDLTLRQLFEYFRFQWMWLQFGGTHWFKHSFGPPRQLTHAEACDLLVAHALKVNKRWKPNGPSIKEFREGLESGSSFKDITKIGYAMGD
jgi:hypothetical protein